MLPESEPLMPQEVPPYNNSPDSVNSPKDTAGQLEQKALSPISLGETEEDDEVLAWIEQFIKANHDLFYMLSEGSNVRIKPGDGFFIKYCDPIEISLSREDWQRLLKREIDDDEQMIWSTCHEIAHYLDLIDDPHGMMENFRVMEKTARRKAQLLIGKWRRSIAKRYEGVVPDYFNEQFVERIFVQALHTFYNCLDDVYVNNMVAQKLPARYGVEGEKRDVVRRLYQEQLFATSDLSMHLKSEQLGYAILRRNMIPGEQTIISEEVEERLSKPLAFEGIRGTAGELFSSQHILRPRSGENHNKPGNRYAMIRAHLEPLFWQLMEMDIETGFLPPQIIAIPGGGGSAEGQPDTSTGENSDKSGEGESQGGKKDTESTDEEEKGGNNAETTGEKEDGESKDEESQEGGKGAESADEEGGENEEEENPWDIINQNKNPITKETIEEFLNAKAEYEAEVAAKEEERRLTPAQRAARDKIQLDERLSYTYGQLNPERAREIAEEWAQLRESVRPYIKELDAVFERFLGTINERISMVWKSGFKSGRFNTKDFIRKYGPELVMGSMVGDPGAFIDFDEISPFMRKEFISRLRIVPDNLTFRLVLDNSLSMGAEKIIMVKQLMVLIYESIKSLEARVNINYNLPQPFRIDLQVQTFASETHLAKPLGTTGYEERGQMLAALGFLTGEGGGTFDSQAWKNITEELRRDRSKVRQIKEGSARDIAIEITDGFSESAGDTQEAIREYMGQGGVPCGIIIMDAAQGDAPAFNDMFLGRGRYVSSASRLPKVFCDLLKEQFEVVLRDIEIEPGFENE